ncbi:FkbM family methyltransferase [Selenomonas sp. ND2010]|uniref:FkbM family methyltransferase n=1 Tax=Selenomonas sp. ND2010 TaxID=1410618 RepID=UPI000692047E|nr:FkbM family methyltransferase [Selenomonas sp. ND2010]
MNIHFSGNRYVSVSGVEGGFISVPVEIDLDASVDFYRLLWQELPIVNPLGKSFCRIGREYDGGYLMLDDFHGKVAYSFGINTDVSWDEDIANRGYDVYMYDHTINALPYERKEFHWFKKGLADKAGDESPLHFLDWFLWKNQHMQEEHMLLKMDVEGAEWGGLEQVNPLLLTQFDQIVLEIHDLIKAHTDQKRAQILSVLHKLNQTHYLVHVHGNNCGFALTVAGQVIPDTLELTLVNKQLYSVDMEAAVILPRELDQANDPARPDYVLGEQRRIGLKS